MDRRHNDMHTGRTNDHLVDKAALRAAIATTLAQTPVDEDALRRCVWVFVGTERHLGTSPGHVLVALTELVEGATALAMLARQDLMRKVILWCVEAYFGHLGGDVVRRDSPILADESAAKVTA